MKRYWYKFRVKYGKELDAGKKKKVSEEYLVDAESFTETEKRANKAATELIGTRDFDITAISREPITEILRDDEDEDNHWYKAVVALFSVDEESGTRKSSPQPMYVNASDINNAANMLADRMSDSNIDWEIKSIAETKVLGVLNYKA
jgi:hypothetical protein